MLVVLGLPVWFSICVYLQKNLEQLLLQKNFWLPTVSLKKRYESKLFVLNNSLSSLVNFQHNIMQVAVIYVITLPSKIAIQYRIPTNTAMIKA